jgi:hypothetical protein
MPMRRLICTIVIAVAAGVTANAWAAVVPYYSTSYWTPGMGGGTAFNPNWYSNVFGKAAAFDTTVTFIDNTGYNWRATVRGFQTYQETHWLTSQVKKAHCRSNVSATIYGSCIAYS